MTFDDDVYYNCLAGESDSAGPERRPLASCIAYQAIRLTS
jgi:hypothetical protein